MISAALESCNRRWMIVGTYSSIFIASPMVLWSSQRAGMKQLEAQTETSGGSALIVADFSFHSLGRVALAQVRSGFC
jgi:hypothetical protein